MCVGGGGGRGTVLKQYHFCADVKVAALEHGFRWNMKSSTHVFVIL